MTRSLDELCAGYSLELRQERTAFDAVLLESHADADTGAMSAAFRSFLRVIMMRHALRYADEGYPPLEKVRAYLKDAMDIHREKLRELLPLLMGDELSEWETLEQGESEAEKSLDDAERAEDMGGRRLRRAVLEEIRKRKQGE